MAADGRVVSPALALLRVGSPRSPRAAGHTRSTEPTRHTGVLRATSRSFTRPLAIRSFQRSEELNARALADFDPFRSELPLKHAPWQASRVNETYTHTAWRTSVSRLL
jgi:hypothetical protein